MAQPWVWGLRYIGLAAAVSHRLLAGVASCEEASVTAFRELPGKVVGRLNPASAAAVQLGRTRRSEGQGGKTRPLN